MKQSNEAHGSIDNGVRIVSGSSISHFLPTNGRLYLCGSINEPQGGFNGIIDAVLDSANNETYADEMINAEFGIGSYETCSYDPLHYHSKNIEYNYVLSGTLHLYLPKTNDEYTITDGSLLVILPCTPYASVAESGTKVLFSKIPGGNDKILVPESDEVSRWVDRIMCSLS